MTGYCRIRTFTLPPGGLATSHVTLFLASLPVLLNLMLNCQAQVSLTVWAMSRIGCGLLDAWFLGPIVDCHFSFSDIVAKPLQQNPAGVDWLQRQPAASGSIDPQRACLALVAFLRFAQSRADATVLLKCRSRDYTMLLIKCHSGWLF